MIGQAKGMIMERFDVDAVRAFELLTRVSQNTNTPVANLAADIVARGSMGPTATSTVLVIGAPQRVSNKLGSRSRSGVRGISTIATTTAQPWGLLRSRWLWPVSWITPRQ